MTPDQELEVARDAAEYAQGRVETARKQHLFWRDELRRQQYKVARLLKVVSRLRCA